MAEKQFQITADGVQALNFLSKLEKGWLSVAQAQDRLIRVQAQLNEKNKATSFAVKEIISLGQYLEKTYAQIEGRMTLVGKQIVVSFEEQARAARKMVESNKRAFVDQVAANRRAQEQMQRDMERGQRELQQLNSRLRQEERAGIEQYNRWVDRQRAAKASTAAAEAKSTKELAALNSYYRQQEIAGNQKAYADQKAANERRKEADKKAAADFQKYKAELQAKETQGYREYNERLAAQRIERVKADDAEAKSRKQLAEMNAYYRQQEIDGNRKAYEEQVSRNRQRRLDQERANADYLRLKEKLTDESRGASKYKTFPEQIQSDRAARAKSQRDEEKALRDFARLKANYAKQEAEGLKPIKQRIEETNNSLIKQIFHWETLTRVAAIHLMYRGLGLLNNALNESIQGTIKLQKSLSELQTVSQGASGAVESTARWLQVISAQSSRFGTSLEDNIEAAYQGLSNQVINTTSDFQTFQTEVNRFAIATQSTTAQSVELLTSYINAFGMSVADVDKIAASAFKTIELGRVRANEMANTIGRILVPAAELGVTMDEVNSLIALATLRGVKFSEAQTQIRGVLTKLIKPTEDMQAILKSLGQESGEAAVKAFGFAGTMKLLADAVAGSSEATAKLFPDVRGLNLAFLLQGKGLEDYNNILKQTTASQQSYDRAVEYGLASTGKKLEIELTRARNYLKTEVGPQILETLNSMTFGFKAILPAAKATFSAIKVAVPALGLAALIGGVDLLTTKIDRLKRVASRTDSSIFSVLAGKITPATGAFLAGSAVFLAFEAVAANQEKQRRKFEEDLNRARQAVDDFQLHREQAIDKLIQRENQYFDTIYRGYTGQAAVVTTTIQKELTERRLASQQLQKILDQDLTRVVDRAKNLAEATRKEITDLTNSIETNKKKISELPLERENTLFDWKLERLSADQQFNFIMSRIKQLQGLRQAAVAEGATNEFERITKEIDSLVSKLGSISNTGEKSTGKQADASKYRDEVSRLERKRTLLLQDIEDAKTDKAREKLKLQLRNLDAQLESTRNKARAAANTVRTGNELSDKASSIQAKYNQLKDEELQLRYRILETDERARAQAERRLKAQERNAQIIKETKDSLDAFQKQEEFKFDKSLPVTRAQANLSASQAALGGLDPNSPDAISQQAAIRDAQLNVAKAKQGEIARQVDDQIANAKRLREALRQTYSQELADLQQKYAETSDITERAFVGRDITALLIEGRKKLAALDQQIANFQEQKALEIGRIEVEAQEKRISGVREELQLREQAARKRFEEAATAEAAGQKALADLQGLRSSIDEAYRQTKSTRYLPPGVNIYRPVEVDTRNMTEDERIRSAAESSERYRRFYQDFGSLNRKLFDDQGKARDISNFSYKEIQEIIAAYDKLRPQIKGREEFPAGSTGAEKIGALNDAIEALRNYNSARLSRIQSEREIKGIQEERKKAGSNLEPPEKVFANAVEKFSVNIDKILEALGATKGNVQGKAMGGRIYGFSNGGLAPSDTVNTRLTPGEFVTNKRDSEKYLSLLMTMNQGVSPRMNARNSGTTFQFGDMNISVPAGTDGASLAREVIGTIRTQLSTGALRL